MPKGPAPAYNVAAGHDPLGQPPGEQFSGGSRGRYGRRRRRRRRRKEEEGLFKADAVNEEDPERDRATQV